LTGGDLIATTAVVGGAAVAVGGAAVAGVGALAGGGGAAAGAGSAASAGGAGFSTRSAVASVGSVGASLPAGGDSVSPPLSPSPGSSVSDGAERGQPDPPSRGSSFSISSDLSSIGGEPLEGSGFETERVQRGFAHMSVTANDQTPALGPSPSGLSVRGGTSADGEGGAPSNLANPDSTGMMSDFTSVGSAGPASPQPPLPANRKNPLTRAVDQVRGLRRRIRSLPSDAAPHATPPRIPIDHEE
jgi:type IV secretion system protein TrbL